MTELEIWRTYAEFLGESVDRSILVDAPGMHSHRCGKLFHALVPVLGDDTGTDSGLHPPDISDHRFGIHPRLHVIFPRRAIENGQLPLLPVSRGRQCHIVAHRPSPAVAVCGRLRHVCGSTPATRIILSINATSG